MRYFDAMKSLLAIGLLLGVLPLLVGDRPDLERQPNSCRNLARLQERCRLDGCAVREIERWREMCKRDSTGGRGVTPPVASPSK